MYNNEPIEYEKNTFSEYLSLKTHICASDVKNFLHSPKYYYYMAYEKKKDPLTDGRHYSIGSALHEKVLEPHLFNQNYVVTPKFDKRTTKGKEAYEKFVSELNGRTAIFDEEMQLIEEMSQSALKNTTLIELLKDSSREYSYYTTDEKTGLKIRLRPDSMASVRNAVTDIKTCLDASYVKFRKDVYNFDYAITSVFYSHFLNVEDYIFCAIEKEPPFQTSLFQLDDDWLAWANPQMRMALDLIKWSIDNQYWCDYTEFEILKDCYHLKNLKDFFKINEESEKIIILRK